MAHTVLSLIVSLIPQETKDNVPTFWLGRHSNDGIKNDDGTWSKEPSRILIDGYNENRELVHHQKTFDSWLQWSESPLEIQEQLLLTATEYTGKEYKQKLVDNESVWFYEANY